MKYLFSLVVLTFITSCGLKPIRNEHLENFSKYCYSNLPIDIKKHSGEQVLNCGFYNWLDEDTTNSEYRNGAKCAQKAYEEKIPFKFGYLTIGYDSHICDILVTNSKGVVTYIDFDYDSAGMLRTKDGNSVLHIQECEELTFVAHMPYIERKNCYKKQRK